MTTEDVSSRPPSRVVRWILLLTSLAVGAALLLRWQPSTSNALLVRDISLAADVTLIALIFGRELAALALPSVVVAVLVAALFADQGIDAVGDLLARGRWYTIVLWFLMVEAVGLSVNAYLLARVSIAEGGFSNRNKAAAYTLSTLPILAFNILVLQNEGLVWWTALIALWSLGRLIENFSKFEIMFAIIQDQISGLTVSLYIFIGSSVIIAAILLIFWSQISAPILLCAIAAETIYIGAGARYLVAAELIPISVRHAMKFFAGVVIIGFFAFSASGLNDNYELDYRAPAPRAEDAIFAAERWLSQHPDGPATLFVVVSEGGGARASYLTALILQALREGCPAFRARHFATIAVSGGSVGAALQAAAETTSAASAGRCELPLYTADKLPVAVSLAQADLLRSVLAGFVPDIVVRALPTSLWRTYGAGTGQMVQRSPLRWADRTRTMIRAIATSWTDATGRTGLDDLSFAAVGPASGGAALILLTTDVRSGRRIAFSHLALAPPDPLPPNAPCLQAAPSDTGRTPADRSRLLTFDEIAPGHDPTLLDAAFASARFPVVSPAATLPCPDPGWRVVDGGFFENSGITTFLELGDRLAQTRSILPRRLRLVAIRIENGDAPSNRRAVIGTAVHETTAYSGDLSAPFTALVATRDARADQARAVLEARRHVATGPGCDPQATTGICLTIHQVRLRLARCNVPVPLGWTLSDAARHEVLQQSGLAALKASDDCSTNIAVANREHMDQILACAKGSGSCDFP